MIPALVNEAAPVPPLAYHRAQTRLGPALHIDALTLVNTLHLLTLCRLAVRLAHHRCPPPLPACPCGGFPIRTCTTSCVTGLPWRVACREGEMVVPASLLPHSNGSREIAQRRRCQKRSLSSRS